MPDAAWDEFLDYLHRRDHAPANTWAPEIAPDDMRCHPDLSARLTELSRPNRAVARVWIAGRPVVQHPHGIPIAAASGTNFLAVRSDRPPGALAAPNERPAGLDDGWQVLNPWLPDIAFAKGTDLLAAHVTRAYEMVEAAWR